MDRFVYSQQPGYDENATRAAFANAVPLRTIVIYCYDPRAVAIPGELAKLWPDETYPGDLVLDDHGNKVGSTATIFPIVVAGGRATDALRSITIGHHLFGLQNVVVVHHTNCGTSSFTPQGLLDAYRTEQGVDLSTPTTSTASRSAISKRHSHYDVDLLRRSPAVPAHGEDLRHGVRHRPRRIHRPDSPRRNGTQLMQTLTTPFGFESTADDVIRGVDLTGKRAVVTGATSGLGRGNRPRIGGGRRRGRAGRAATRRGPEGRRRVATSHGKRRHRGSAT